MLLGEYAVLYGHDALSCAFDARIAVTARALPTPRIVVVSPRVLDAPLDLPRDALAGPPPPGLSFVWACLRARGDALAALLGLALEIEAGFPSEWGLGSSSAVAVATLAALGALAGLEVDPGRIGAEAGDLQRDVQGGIGSGYDAANQATGGMIRYRRTPGAPAEVESLPLPPPHGPVLRAAFTGRKVATPGLVADVSRRHPPGSAVYGELGDLARRGCEAARFRRWEALGGLLDAGQALQVRLGTCPTDLADRTVSLRATPGVLGAKLTGAGGGDSVLLLAADDASAVLACARAGLILLPARPDPRGLRPEEPARR